MSNKQEREEAYFVASLDTVAVQHGRAQVVHEYGELLAIGRSVGEALSMYNVGLDELVQLKDVRGAREVQPLHNVQIGVLKFNGKCEHKVDVEKEERN